MVASVLVKDVLWRVSQQLNDVLPQFNRWPEREVVMYLNDAQLVLTAILPQLCSRIDAVKLKPGTRQSIETIAAVDCKPGDGSVPAAPIYGVQLLEVVRNMGANGQTPGRPLRVVDRRILDAEGSNWHSTQGETIDQFVYDPQVPLYFYVDPGVHPTTAVWVEVKYLARPTLVPAGGAKGSELYKFDGVSTAKISVSDECVPLLVDYICARCYMKGADYADNGQKAAQHEASFVSFLNARVQSLLGTSPNLKRLPMSPGLPGGAS